MAENNMHRMLTLGKEWEDTEDPGYRSGHQKVLR